jgi:hypothetical protein
LGIEKSGTAHDGGSVTASSRTQSLTWHYFSLNLSVNHRNLDQLSKQFSTRAEQATTDQKKNALTVCAFHVKGRSAGVHFERDPSPIRHTATQAGVSFQRDLGGRETPETTLVNTFMSKTRRARRFGFAFEAVLVCTTTSGLYYCTSVAGSFFPAPLIAIGHS